MTNILPIERLRQLNRKHWQHCVWSYFPTPPLVIRALLSQARLQDGLKILEPSAGKGAIVQKIFDHWNCSIDCIEQNRDFQEILHIKGFNVVGEDFSSVTPKPVYDRVIANPPFDRQMTHIPQMYRWLRPGGRLVTVANACFLEPDKEQFKDLKYANERSRAGLYHHLFAWLEATKATITRLPKGSFSTASRTTAVDTVMIVASKS